MRRIFSISLVISLALSTMTANAQRKSPQPKTAARGTTGAAGMKTAAASNAVLLPNRSPLVSFRILFMTGAADDPAGKEGLAALTASLVSGGGTRTLAYEKIQEAFYPMATSFSSQVDKEMTVFTGTTHADNLPRYYALISQMLLDPGFRADDFARIRNNTVSYLKVTLREGNDEELGKEQLYNNIYAGHPYGHHNYGGIGALGRITLEDVREFYRTHYTQANMVLGLAGGYPATFPAKVKADFAKLPAGTPTPSNFYTPKLEPGTQIDIIKRETRSTAISLGFPIDVTRADPDWPALAVVASYFGQHRSSNSYLYQRLREARGLNYGDYAYIEYFPGGMFQFEPEPNLARQQQIFQIWIRPVPPEQGHFVLRAALYEYDKLVREGLAREAFEATREFLTKYSNILTATQDARLGYALDSRYYKIGDFNNHMRDRLSRLTLEDVNAVIKKYLATNRMRIVVVTKDAEALRDAILANKPSPMTYNSPKPQAILDEDKIIQVYPIDVRAEQIRITPVDQVFP
ncbi:MAG TPA: pitrilysin family protein [Pyrinomonadaceae bacterium]|nr:pitrilysin family protein [Pyrinomonadaceae bacterium]